MKREGWEAFVIPAGSRYRSPGEVFVEGDASSASYFVGLGAIAPPMRRSHRRRRQRTLQGDVRFIEAAARHGAEVETGPNWLEVRRGAWPLKGLTLDCNHIPDAAMTLTVMALYADGPTTLTNIASWRVRRPTASPPWPPSCASWARRSTKARTGSAYSRCSDMAEPPPSTPTTTTGSRCASPWRPSTAW